MNKRKSAKRILIGILAVIMIAAGIIPFITQKTNAAETSISDKISLVTENETRTSQTEGYSKVTFKVENAEDKVVYIKNQDTIKLVSTDKNYGVLVGGVGNDNKITEDSTIYVKSYSYEGKIDLEKSISNAEPDENGYYTLNFKAKSKNLPAIKSEAQSVVLVIDRSLSMACSVDADADADPMASTYENTRWYAMTKAIDSFLDEFLAKGDNNKITIVSYCGSVDAALEDSSSKSDIMNYINNIYNKDRYDSDYKKYKNNVSQIERGLGSGTNIQAALNKASELLGNNAAGSSVILFTDGAANNYSGDKLFKKERDKIDGVIYNGSESYINSSYYANKAGNDLKAKGVNVYTVALMNGISESDNLKDQIKAALGRTNFTYETVYKNSVFDWRKTVDYRNIKFTEGGYAKQSYTATNLKELIDSFKQIVASITALPFETSQVTDALDSHFELVPGQEGVKDNGDGTFTVTYPDAVSSNEQTISVKIKAKEGYAGSSYTNNGCVFEGTVGNLTYTEEFKQKPDAIIKPNAVNDSYTINQDETLNASTVLENDDNELVNNTGKNVSLKAVKTTDTKNGTVTFNEDGTFSYVPDEGFSGNDSFEYNVVLTVDGKEYTKSATVYIEVIPKYTLTINYQYEDGTKAAETVTQTVIRSNSTTEVISPEIKGYKPDIEKVEAKVLTENEQVNVIYVKDDSQTKKLTYKVEYYKDGINDTAADVVEEVTNDVWINDNVSPVDGDKINTTGKFGAGYEFVKTNPETIPAVIEDKGIIKVYYKISEYDYTVKYVIKGTDTEIAEGYTRKAEYDSEVGADKKQIPGFTAENADKKIRIGAEKNILIIEYTANEVSYTVNYLEKDTNKVLAKSKTVKSVFNAEVNEEALEITGYAYDEKTKSLIMKEKDNVINFYYTANSYNYTVEYYYDNNKDDSATFTEKAAFNSEIVNYEDKSKTGYALSKVEGVPLKISEDAAKNVIRIYYEREEYAYTINYYYDGIKDDNATIKATLKYAESVNGYKDKIKTGYKLDKVTGLTDGKLIITEDPSKNVIDVYYVKDTFEYTVEYYYDGIINEDATVKGKAEYGSIITKYADKNITGYKLDKVTGLINGGLTITEKPENNVIRVYYIPDNYKVTVQYYINNVINNDLTYTFEAAYGSIINQYKEVTILNAELKRVENLGLKVSEDETKNIIKVYYTVPEVGSDEEEIKKTEKEPEVAANEEIIETPQTSDRADIIILMTIMLASGVTAVTSGKKGKLTRQK